MDDMAESAESVIPPWGYSAARFDFDMPDQENDSTASIKAVIMDQYGLPNHLQNFITEVMDVDYDSIAEALQ